MKIPAIILFLLYFYDSYSQDSLQLFYINKIALSESDSAEITKCKKSTYTNVSLKIILMSKNKPEKIFYTVGQNYRWWKDSVFFSYSIPPSTYDSMSIFPTYHIACSGLDGNRGTEVLEAEGVESNMKSIKLKFISNPPGATVYLIPKLIWERTPGLSTMKNQAVLNHYILYNGQTPVSSTAQEYVYIALFKYNGNFLPIECSPNHSKPDDSVYANFTQR